jgi:hypothetical protein
MSYKILKIKALATINGNTVPCTGNIEIKAIEEPQTYVTWRMSDSTNNLASKSSNFYFRTDTDTEEELIKRVITQVENYRMSRVRIFSCVEIVP